MDIGRVLIITTALCILVFVTRWAFIQTRIIGKTFLRGFAPVFSIALFAVLLYEVDIKSPIPYVDDVMFSALVALTSFALLRVIFRYVARARNILKKKFPNIGRLYSKV